MSPEAIAASYYGLEKDNSKMVYLAKSDVWSLGICLLVSTLNEEKAYCSLLIILIFTYSFFYYDYSSNISSYCLPTIRN